MLNIKCIPRKALVLVLGGGMILPNISPAMINDTAGCAGAGISYPYIAGANDNPLFISSDHRPTNNINQVMMMEIIRTINNQTTFQTVRAARHHIIPYQVLRDFYNAVITRGQSNPLELRTFGQILLHLVDNASRLYQNTISLSQLDDARSVALDFMHGVVLGDETRFSEQQVSGLYAIRTLFTWFPANIFIGPDTSYRFDDPGNGFEWNARSIVGAENFNRLEALHNLMVAYINKRNTLDHGWSVIMLARMVSMVSLFKALDNVVTISNAQNWFEPPDWYGDERVGIGFNGRVEYVDVQNLNPPENMRKKRENKNNFIVKRLPTIADPYCLMAPKIVKKKLVASLFTDINPDLNTNKEPKHDELRK
ncbi:cell wall hydrolase [Candidatus Williamhamiltonella defendens]|uniref:Putative protein p9 n=2 Tax=root TaxID=1 RepID=VP09_BPAPS|nr:hypothetical protein [Candidatus Hamiltonella defensa]NP_050970.1 putative cell wall hydrolase [Hamiltonella phage APSE-1]Q9T1T9.1 RecName: Full=Putative protein p9 [Hamiltonella phage APSE-1]AAF03952.1 P9 [Hamiltonella phage APSE-1]ASV34114.1 cell wall hydrolase [Candidatus Hamiltonella defensa]